MKNDYYTTVIFLRHGQSTWNQQNIFIGMTDTPLTHDGIEEAKVAGRLLSNEDVQFDVIYTSLLRRSIKTAWMVLQELGWYPLYALRCLLVSIKVYS
jgi:2,3-bisphosphoglycerate-dependent phosphoglycerate mutase